MSGETHGSTSGAQACARGGRRPRVRRPLRVARGGKRRDAHVAGGAERRRRAPPAGCRRLRGAQGATRRLPRCHLRQHPAAVWRALAAPGARRRRRAHQEAGRRPGRAMAVRLLGRGSLRTWQHGVARLVLPLARRAFRGRGDLVGRRRAVRPAAARYREQGAAPRGRVGDVVRAGRLAPRFRRLYFPTGDFMEARPRDLCFLRPGDAAPLRESLLGVVFESASPEAPAGYPQVSADGRWLTLASERFGGRIALARRLPGRRVVPGARGHG